MSTTTNTQIIGALSTVTNSLHKNTKPSYTTLRDYRHAQHIFGSNNGSFIPKSKNWFHVFFELNAGVVDILNNSLLSANKNGAIHWNPSDLPIFGILVKSAKLPSFKFDIKKSNNYNKWDLNPTKINIDLTFWDDTSSEIRALWYAYYQYMIQDPSYSQFSSNLTQGLKVPSQLMQSYSSVNSIYTTSPQINGSTFGMDTVNSSGVMSRSGQFFKSIRIYQFSRPIDNIGAQYSEYILVNPLISSFDHDSMETSSSEPMTCKMAIECESVLYNGGYIEGSDGNTPQLASWEAVKQRFFDTTPSPLTGFKNSNSKSQLSSVLGHAFSTATQVAELALGTGQSTVTSVLTSGIATGSALTNLKNNPNGIPNITVPVATTGYGTGGNPPSQR